MNIQLFIPFIVLIGTECLKTIIQSIRAGHFQPDWFMKSGGMPSGHSSFTSSIATIIGVTQGVDSPEFLLAVGFAVIVMYDARGVRMAVSRQAKALNRLINKKTPHLEESVGHTNAQVIMGCITGITLSMILVTLLKNIFV